VTDNSPAGVEEGEEAEVGHNSTWEMVRGADSGGAW